MRELALAVVVATMGICAVVAPALAIAEASPLTPGNVSLHLVVGKTTQAEVLDVFGAPNIVTQDGGRSEVWSYQRHASITEGKGDSAYFNILVLGAGGGKESSTTTQRSMTLIIKFDADHVVSDFRSRSSEF